jgi:uncharacterized protein YciI
VTKEVYTVYLVRAQADAGSVDLSRLLARDYWLILSTPAAGVDRAAIEARVAEHVAWLLELERPDLLFASGPLLSGPGVGPGSGVTVLRAADEEAARDLAAGDPFVRAGLRTFAVHRWRLNEGSVDIRLSWGPGPTNGADRPGDPPADFGRATFRRQRCTESASSGWARWACRSPAT